MKNVMLRLVVLVALVLTALPVQPQRRAVLEAAQKKGFGGGSAGVTESELFNDTLTRTETPAASPWICLFSSTANREFNLDGADAVPELVSTDCGMYYTGIAIATNQYIKITASTSGGSAGSGIGVGVRVKTVSPDTTGYRVVACKAGSNNWEISKYVAGVQSGAVQFTQAWNDTDEIKVYCTGTTTVTIQVFLNGSQIGSNWTDSSSTLQAGAVAIWYSSTTTTPKIHTARGGSLL